MSNLKSYVKFFEGFEFENRIYFFNMVFNAVFSLNLIDLKLHYEGYFSLEHKSRMALSTGMNFAYKDEIYFVPNGTNSIMKYSIRKKQDTIISLPDYQEEVFRTIGYIRFNQKIYLFPYDFGMGIYVFDLQSQKIQKDDELSALFKAGMLCANVLLMEGFSVLIGMRETSCFIELDIERKKILKKNVLSKDISIDNVCFDGTHYWILQSESTEIFEWNREKNTLQKYANKNIEWNNSEYAVSNPYSDIIFLKDEILVLNCYLKKILRINKEKKTIENPIDFPEAFQLVNRKFEGWPVCNGFKVFEDKVFIYPCRGNMLLIYDVNTKQMSGKEMFVLEDEVPYLREVVQELLFENKVNAESGDLEIIQNYINMIGKTKRNLQSDKGVFVGKKIFNRLKEI